MKVWDEVYLYETNRLAQILYVANYKDPFQARYRFERSGAEFIQALPGPADTAVGANIYPTLPIAEIMLDALIGGPFIYGQGRSGSFVDKAAQAIPGIAGGL